MGARVWMGVVAVLGVAAGGPASASAARPDLVVSKGSVLVSVAGRVTGKFVVANTGRARAARTSAVLTVRAGGRDRVLRRFRIPALRRSTSRTVTVALTLPRPLPAVALPVQVCADGAKDVRERSERNNCRRLGTTTAAAPRVPPTPAAPSTSPAVAAPAAPAAAPPAPPLPVVPPPPTPASSVPTDPLPFTKDEYFDHTEAEGGDYWIYVPTSYDDTHATPTTLFVWLHGCGGYSRYDIAAAAPGGDQDYLAIAPGGREGDCWDVDADPAAVLAAIADVKTHFNVDPRRVILGGYSSGGDLAYRTAFYNASLFAGVLAENTSPFRDTGSTQSASLAAASWKLPVVHLAHTEDTTYPLTGVAAETDAMAAAGFPITRIERPGHHWDDDTATTGTNHDLETILLPYLDAGWLAP